MKNKRNVIQQYIDTTHSFPIGLFLRFANGHAQHSNTKTQTMKEINRALPFFLPPSTRGCCCLVKTKGRRVIVGIEGSRDSLLSVPRETKSLPLAIDHILVNNNILDGRSWGIVHHIQQYRFLFSSKHACTKYTRSDKCQVVNNKMKTCNTKRLP